ncbi:unnamed protein product [Rangifer tarandus platyrhynchus]|uniref:Uncharacterized protein n=1 Tax=Rangifer tarandus platyrhynchus TaxID=3082113 RepID=A0ABN8ZD71_RANTA|nr:unnamed protein product [Rangifer tarandus platyrhynchus]CAI9689276.1 unnamed protein product [Rangifer tarandus platyrhynchus]
MNGRKVGIRAESRRKRGREMNLETVTKVRNSQGEDREKQRPGCRENGSGKERARSQRLCKLLASAPSERGNRDRPLSFTPGRSHRMLHVRPEASKGCVLSLDFFGKQAKGQPVAIVTTVSLGLCSPEDRSTPGSAVLQCLPEHVQIHVH